MAPHLVASIAITCKASSGIMAIRFRNVGVPVVAQWLMNPTGTMRLQVESLAYLSGLRIQRCRDLWCRSQTWLGSCVAVALA